jgi:hypothetical protein
MSWMMLIIIAVVLYFVLRSRRTDPGYNQWNAPGVGHGYGMLAGGMLLGYLLSNNLINHEQYDDWKNMNSDELKQTLTDNGIVSAAEFDSLSQQFDTQDSDFDGSGFDSQDYSDSSDIDGSGFDDFGDF